MNTLFPLVARILMALIFLESGASKLTGWSATAAMMQAQGLSYVPLLLAGAIVVELGGGLMLLFGFKARLAALLLFLYLIPTTPLFHAFWRADAAQAMLQRIEFLKNLAIMGGLLEMVAYGPGRLSLDQRHEVAPPRAHAPYRPASVKPI